MTLTEILLVIIGAVIVGVLFYYIFKTTGPWGTFWSFLLILILAGLAANAWVAPMGPMYGGISWIPTLFVMLLFALFLAAATPTHGYPRAEVPKTGTSRGERAGIALSAFFWLLLFFLLIAAVWRMF